MADQGRSSQYGTATPDCTPPSSPRDSSPDSSQRSKRDEQLDAARRNEINILTQLRHDNIIGYTKELDGSVKLEKLDTTLESRLKEPTQMTLFQKLSVARDLAQAITYLHGLTRPILHLNIQPSSVQLGSRVGILAKLSEFGVACHADELRAGPLGGPLGSTPANSSNPQTSPDSNSDSHHSSPSRNPTSTSSSTTTTTPHHGLQEQDTYKAGRATPNGSPHSTSSTASTSTPSSTSSVSSSSSSSSSSSHSPNTQSANGTRPPAPTAQVMAAMRGAPLYNPPEALRGEPYTEAADVYSFGLTMTELILGSSPFIAVRSLAGLMAAIEAPIIFPDDLPPHIADLLSRCRAVDPRRRPHFSEILVTLNEMFVPVFVHENIDWARQFWMDYFPGSISVRWSDFCGQLIRCLKLPTTPNEVTFRGVQKSKDNAAGIATRRLHCLKQLMFPGLSDDSDFLKSINLWIDIDKYGHIMGTFSDENTRLDSLLETVANLIETRWFHGDATGSSGPHRLAPDTFLIRLSAPAQNSLKPPNCWFTFSLKTSAGNFVRETRIQRQPGRSECLLANSSRETFSSLFQLAETKGKPYGLAPVPSFLHSTLHPVSAEYTTDEEDM